MLKFYSLTRSQSRRVQGMAYKLTEAVPVDLFPHTPHFELVMKFERDTRKKPTADVSNSSTEEKHVSENSDVSAENAGDTTDSTATRVIETKCDTTESSENTK